MKFLKTAGILHLLEHGGYTQHVTTATERRPLVVTLSTCHTLSVLLSSYNYTTENTRQPTFACARQQQGLVLHTTTKFCSSCGKPSHNHNLNETLTRVQANTSVEG